MPVCPSIDIGRLKGSGNPFRSIASGACEALLTYGMVLYQLLDGLLTGNAEDFAEALSNYLRLLASFYDTAARESFYHGLVLGLLATLMPRFEVVSNRESGYGRFDVAIFPGKGQTAGALLEFKVAETEAEMPERAKEALAQIEANQYAAEFERRGVKDFWQYGIAFWGKKCHIETGGN